MPSPKRFSFISALALTLSSSAWAMDCGQRIHDFVTQRLRPPLTNDQLEARRVQFENNKEKHLADFFPSLKVASTDGLLAQVSGSPPRDELTAFAKNLSSTLKLAPPSQRLSPWARKWWSDPANQARLLSKSSLRDLLTHDPNFDEGQFMAVISLNADLDKIHADQRQVSKLQKIVPALQNPYVLGLAQGISVAALSSGNEMLRILKTSVAVGPMASITNAFVSPLSNPIASKAGQFGAINLNHLSQAEQAILSHWTVESPVSGQKTPSGAVARDDLNKLYDDLQKAKKLPSPDRQKIQKDLEKIFYEYLMAFQQFAPRPDTEGRSLLIDTNYQRPLSYATSASTFANSYRSLREEKIRIEKDLPQIKERLRLYGLNPHPTEEEKELHDQDQEDMDTLQSADKKMEVERKGVATTLVVWSITEGFFPDMLHPEDAKGKPIPTDYTLLKSEFFDEYMDEVTTETKDLADKIKMPLDIDHQIDRLQAAKKLAASVSPASSPTP